MDNPDFYKSIPTFNNQKPCSLESFNNNLMFEDKEFLPIKESLVTIPIIKWIGNEIHKHNFPDDKKYYKEMLNDAYTLLENNEWRRISEIFKFIFI